MTDAPPTNLRVFLSQFCHHDCWRRPDCEWVWEGKEDEQCPAYLAFAERAKWHPIECWAPNTDNCTPASAGRDTGRRVKMTPLEEIAYLNGRITELEKQIAELKADLLKEQIKPLFFMPGKKSEYEEYAPRPLAYSPDSTVGGKPIRPIFVS